MTKVQIYKKNNKIVCFQLKGHTNFATSGEDILCAAVSAVAQSTALGILKVLNIKALYETNDKQGYLKLDLNNNTDAEIESAQVLLETMHKSLDDISIGNGKHIKVEVYDGI